MRTLRVERERVESESIRKRRQRFLKLRRIVGAILAITVIAGGVSLIVKLIADNNKRKQLEVELKQKEYPLTVPIMDENRVEISPQMKRVAGKLQQGIVEQGRGVEKIVIPKGKIRELYVFLKEEKWFVKVSVTREVGETVEDLMRMLKYFEEKKEMPKEYLDLRLERRGYYK